MQDPTLNKVLFNHEARQELLKGIKIAADAIGCTLGPKGKNVIIQRPGQVPLVTKDGVTVSKSINLKDPMQRMGAQLVREAASQTNDVAGDGTTTATILAQSLIENGMKLIAAGHQAVDVKTGIDLAVKIVIESLKLHAKPVSDNSEIAQIGTISANGDASIGQLIAEAMAKVGQDGIVTVDEAKGMTTKLEIVEGMKFDRGYLSPYFVTNPDKMDCVLENCRILMTDSKISTLQELVPILEKTMKSAQPLLIIADEVETEPLQGLVINRMRANLQVCAIKAPGYGEHRTHLLQDLAVLTGGKVISAGAGQKILTADIDCLGLATKVIISRGDCLIIATGKTKDAVASRAAQVKSQLEDVTLSEGEVLFHKERLARLAGGIATIKVGGATEVEMKERKDRVEDALNATRAAVEEGIVPGGGTILAKLCDMPAIAVEKNEAIKAGMSVVMSACKAPLRRIVKNAGKSPEVVLNTVLQNSDADFGYNASNDTYGNMIEMGVIDPVKVTRCALENAASVAGIFLTLDAAIVNEEEPVTK